MKFLTPLSISLCTQFVKPFFCNHVISNANYEAFFFDIFVNIFYAWQTMNQCYMITLRCQILMNILYFKMLTERI